MNTGEIIRILREREGYSQADLARKLSLSRSSISMYEANERIPSTYVLENMADLFNVDIDYILARTNKITVLPERLKYENKLAKETTTIDPTRARLNKAYNALNTDGQERVADYADDLHQSGRYEREDEALPFIEKSDGYLSVTEDVTQYITTIGTVAAGAGFEYGDHDEQTKLITAVDIPKHDFIVNVEGNSMFPTIFNGDIAFVCKSYNKDDKQIYVLDIDGETVIKRVIFDAKEITLVSDNPEWPDRTVKGAELEYTRILGRVVGWKSAV